MKTLKLATAVVVLGSLLTGVAVAQIFPGYPAAIPGQAAGSPYSGYQYDAYQNGSYAYAAPQPPPCGASINAGASRKGFLAFVRGEP